MQTLNHPTQALTTVTGTHFHALRRMIREAMQQAVLIMFLAMSLIPGGDAAGKMLSSSLGVSPLFVAWSRFAVGTVLILPFLPEGTFGLLRDKRVWLRALCLTCGITSIQFALQQAEIANRIDTGCLCGLVGVEVHCVKNLFVRHTIQLVCATARMGPSESAPLNKNKKRRRITKTKMDFKKR